MAEKQTQTPRGLLAIEFVDDVLFKHLSVLATECVLEILAQLVERGVPFLAEYRSLRSNPSIEPADVASRVAKIREEYEMVAKLSDMRPISTEGESTKGTGGTAPAQTLVNLASALAEGRRCLLLARGETAEDIRERIEDAPALDSRGSRREALQPEPRPTDRRREGLPACRWGEQMVLQRA